MIPLLVTYDAGWTAETLINSFIPDNITDKDLYVYGFDDRHVLFPNYKDAFRLLNKWYNEGLLWKDFAFMVPVTIPMQMSPKPDMLVLRCKTGISCLEMAMTAFKPTSVV
jgi:ABC-type glycerol-3-phosphate transport system substrate-binding protein